MRRVSTEAPVPVVRGTTRLVALLGDPVDHSRSPAMHNAAFAHDGIDLVYVALPTPRGQIATVLAALKAVGAAGGNVTVPHKQAVAALCDVLTDDAGALGAVNTFWWERGLLHGDNTDVAGIAGDLDELDAPAGPAVVLGTGGAARAATLALVRSGRHVTVVGRRATATDDVVRAVGEAAPDLPSAESVVLVDPDAVRARWDAASLVVNATPLGMDDEDLPAPFDGSRRDLAVYDCVYRTSATPLVRRARDAGAPARDGRGMLLGQAAAAYGRWTGHEAPVPVMAAALARSFSDG